MINLVRLQNVLVAQRTRGAFRRETAESNALSRLCAPLSPLEGPKAVVQYSACTQVFLEWYAGVR